MSIPKPGKVTQELDYIVRAAEALKAEYREAYEIGYGPKHRASAGGRVKGSHSDPTGSIVGDQERVRSQTKVMADLINSAATDLTGARAAGRKAVRLADIPDGYHRSDAPRLITDEELKQARAAQARRQATWRVRNAAARTAQPVKP